MDRSIPSASSKMEPGKELSEKYVMLGFEKTKASRGGEQTLLSHKGERGQRGGVGFVFPENPRGSAPTQSASHWLNHEKGKSRFSKCPRILPPPPPPAHLPLFINYLPEFASIFVSIYLFEAGSRCVAHAGLELTILLPPPA
jgi:hypothetical protein